MIMPKSVKTSFDTFTMTSEVKFKENFPIFKNSLALLAIAEKFHLMIDDPKMRFLRYILLQIVH